MQTMSEARELFVGHVVREATLRDRKTSVHSAVTAARAIIAVSRRHNRAAERLCSDESYSQDRFDASADRTRREVASRLHSICLTGAAFEVSGDPRGCVVKIALTAEMGQRDSDEWIGVPS